MVYAQTHRRLTAEICWVISLGQDNKDYLNNYANSLISFLCIALLAFALRCSAITALNQSGAFRPEKMLMKGD